jgi:hypothetical protein
MGISTGTSLGCRVKAAEMRHFYPTFLESSGISGKCSQFGYFWVEFWRQFVYKFVARDLSRNSVKNLLRDKSRAT